MTPPGGSQQQLAYTASPGTVQRGTCGSNVVQVRPGICEPGLLQTAGAADAQQQLLAIDGLHWLVR